MHWIKHYFHSHETESNKTVNSDNIIKWWTPNDFPNSEIFSWQSVAHFDFFLFLDVFFCWVFLLNEKKICKWKKIHLTNHYSVSHWLSIHCVQLCSNHTADQYFWLPYNIDSAILLLTVAQSQHDWKFIYRDFKNQINQPTFYLYLLNLKFQT